MKKPMQRIFSVALGVSEAEALNVLFVGPHATRKRKIIPKTGGIMGFMIRRASCVVCRCPVDGMDSKTQTYVVCGPCRGSGRERDAREAQKSIVDDLEDLVKKFHKTCTVCVGREFPLEELVPCDNDECKIFYSRETSRQNKDIETAKLSGFDHIS